MLNCPVCASTLSEVVFSTGVCPVCGGALHLEETERLAGRDAAENRPVRLEAPESDENTTDSVARVRAALAAIVRQADPPGEHRPEHVESANEPFVLPENLVRDTARTSAFEEPITTGGPPASRITEIGHTIDVRSLSPEEKARVTSMWKGMATPVASPRMTVKAAEPQHDDTRRTTLVVKPREFRRTHEQERIEADYELLNLIGEGGMGVVYAARQASIDRIVAVKMLNAEIAGDADQRHKFLSEAVVTGDLDHPNIVPIYDLGANETGALFYSMKRVVGTPWMEVIGKYSLAENLEILMKVADAVAFAHSRGVIHRDLKPENVMLGDFGEVLVMDWGLAISTTSFRKSGSITQSHSMGGTPAYMAPEMATGPVERVTAASDIYLLGAMLFEVITGQPPHTGKNIMNCLYAAARNEIQATQHSGELIDIARRAMATEPRDRYPTVQDFQGAIRAYQSHSESIVLSQRAEEDLAEAERTKDYQTYARALFAFEEAVALWSGNTKAAERLVYARLAYAQSATRKEDYDLAASLLDEHEPRHAELRRKIAALQGERQARQSRLRMMRRVAAGLVFTVLSVVSVGLAVVYVLWGQATKAQQIAESRQHDLNIANKDLAKKTQEANDSAKSARESAFAAKQSETAAKNNLTLAQEAQASEARLRSQREYEAYVAQIGLASAKIEENASQQALELLRNCVPQRAESQDYRNWEWGRLLHLCQQNRTTMGVGNRVETVAVDPAGESLLAGAVAGTVHQYTLAGKTLRQFDHGGPVNAVLFLRDGTRALTAGGRGNVGNCKLWDLTADPPPMLLEFAAHSAPVLSAAASRDGTRLATTSADGTVRLWRLSLDSEKPEAAPDRPLVGHSGPVWCVDFAPDERHIATAGQDRTVIIWSLEAARSDWPLPAFRGHTGAVFACAFSPDGKRVVSAGGDRRVLVWEIDQIEAIDLDELAARQTPAPPPRFVELRGHTAEVRTVDFAPDGASVVSASNDYTVKVWDASRGTLLKTLRGHDGWVRSCAFTPDGQRVVTGGYDQTVSVWPVSEYRERLVYAIDDSTPVLASAASPDGKWIATAHQDGAVRLWDRASGALAATFEEGHDFLGETALFLPDGKRILTGARDSTVRIWSVATGGELARLTNTSSTAQTVVTAVDHGGVQLCTGIAGAADNKADPQTRMRTLAQIWDLGGPNVAHELQLDMAPNVELASAAFSPGDEVLYTGRSDGPGELWNAETGAFLRRLGGHYRRVNAAQFTADGRLITASDDHAVLQWDWRAGEKLSGRELFHPAPVTALAVSPDDRIAVTACADGVVRCWDLAGHRVLGTLPHPGETVSSVAISPDCRRAATVSRELAGDLNATNVIHLWDLQSFTEIEVGADRSDGAGWLRTSPRRGALWQACFSPNGEELLAVGGRQARLWKVGERQQVRTFGPQGAVANLAFSHDSALLATAGADGSAKIWDVATHRATQKLEGFHTGRLAAAWFAPGDRQLLTAGEDGQMALWDVAQGVVSRQFERQNARIRSSEFSADGLLVVTAADDGRVRVWNAVDGALVKTIGDSAVPLNCASLSPDGASLLTGDVDNMAQLWDFNTEERRIQFAGHTAEVSAVAFSPDGSRAITAGKDNLVKIWDVSNGKELLTLEGHTAEVTSAGFASGNGGRDILTSSRDGTAILWPAADWRPSLE